MSKFISVAINEESFLNEVRNVVDTAAIYKEVKEALDSISWPPDFTLITKEMSEAVAVVVAAVEVVKNKYKKTTPDGDILGIDSELAADTAAKLLDELFVFKGMIVGRIVEALDRVFFKLAISAFVGAKPNNWYAEAWDIVKKEL